jgi:AcrR family transcriptional regulator
MGAEAATTTSPRRRRADGIRSREAILDGAARLATVEGLDGLSIGRLSAEIGMSKSGLFAHFGSKQDLQVATVGYGEEYFDREVIGPAMTAEPGLARVRALSESFFAYLESGVFPGGCFFASAAAELAPREGPVRDRIRDFLARFTGLLAAEAAMARERGEVDASIDPEQLAFEVDSLMLGANSAFVLFGDPAVIERARIGIEAILKGAGGDRP